MKPAIVLACHTIGLTVIRALGSVGIPVHALTYDEMDMGQVSKYVTVTKNICHPERFEEEFIEGLLNYGRKIGGGVLFPSDDATVTVVSRHKEILSSCYTVACPEWKIVEQFIDKRLTYALADKIGIPSPKTLVPKNGEELAKFARAVEYPCIVKPVHSHRYYELFRKKLVIAKNQDEMAEAYQEASEAGFDVMVQEFIPGSDSSGVNYNSYTWNGRPCVEMTAKKVRLSPPTYGVPRVVVQRQGRRSHREWTPHSGRNEF